MSGPEGARIILVRHAETEWSLSGQHTGRTDIPLTEHGREVAAALRTRLRGLGPERVLTSPLTRATETAELAGLGDRAERTDALLEWDYGDYEGLTSPQIDELRPGWSLWRDGCPGGEDAAQVGARADAVLALIGPRGTTAIFSHGHMLRVIGARWIGLGPGDGALLGLSTAAICVLGSEHGTHVIWRWNDTGPAAAA